MAIRVSGVGSGGRRPPPVREEPPVDILAAARDKAAMELPPAPLASGSERKASSWGGLQL
ncbi:hypothetical protein TRIUR3_03120 [Triticum urartu]|uniref:Uncharacterized protein n=1 Tax=Triticum urartu TaxID=4572 RepID=M7ZCP0_TRIUA|nr:hypothetical protein TRIUR3_03120 [Triticum urartu]